MANLEQRLVITQESKKRIRQIKFGHPVSNICAGEGNPGKRCYFVSMIEKSHKNRYGITHKDYFARCTDGHGKFWNFDINVIHPGHLTDSECAELFEPVWEAHYA